MVTGECSMGDASGLGRWVEKEEVLEFYPRRCRRRGWGRGGEEEDFVAYSWIRVRDELGRRDVSKNRPRLGLLVLDLRHSVCWVI